MQEPREIYLNRRLDIRLLNILVTDSATRQINLLQNPASIEMSFICLLKRILLADIQLSD